MATRSLPVIVASIPQESFRHMVRRHSPAYSVLHGLYLIIGVGRPAIDTALDLSLNPRLSVPRLLAGHKIWVLDGHGSLIDLLADEIVHQPLANLPGFLEHQFRLKPDGVGFLVFRQDNRFALPDIKDTAGQVGLK